MKGGKDEGTEDEKRMGPLFPRFHVDDADDGGPRPPPRNKMSLYEQLSIPSRSFGSSARSVPFLLHNNGGMFSSASSSQWGDHDRSLFTSLFVQHTSAYSTDKIHSWSSDGLNANAASTSGESKLLKNINSKASSVPGHLSDAAGCTLHPHEVTDTGDCGGRKLGGEEDYSLSMCSDSEIASRVEKGTVNLNNPARLGHCTSTAANSSKMHVGGGCRSRPHKSEDKLAKETNFADKKLRQSDESTVGHQSCSAEEKENGTVQVVDAMEKITSSPNMEPMLSERPTCMKSTPSQAFLSGSLNDVSNVCKFKACDHEESTAGFLSRDKRCNDDVLTKGRYKTNPDVMEGENFLRARSKLSSRESPVKTNESLIENKRNRNLQLDDRDRVDDASDTSMMDSISGMEVSPDDVVGAIGSKQFWKARRAILNQQRIFSVQVFELHRLIKVQKFFAESPALLLDDDPYLTTPSEKITDGKVLPDYNSVPQLPIKKQRSQSLKPDRTIKESSYNPGRHIASFNSILNKGLDSQEPSDGRCNVHPSQGPVVTDSTNTTWCFPPLGSQWMVPVVSPCEGLIYMPVTGPCPPKGGFLAPVYGACIPLGHPGASGDIAKPTYGSRPSHQQGGVAMLSRAPSNFPHGLHGVIPSYPTISGGLACAPANPSSTNQASGQAEFSDADVNQNMHSRGPCNVPNQKADAFSCHISTFRAPKDSEFHGSTANIPRSDSERVLEASSQASEGRDSLHLFPLTPAVDKPNQENERGSYHQSRVIKVVPHNTKSATESAARIFRSIQKERQQYGC